MLIPTDIGLFDLLLVSNLSAVTIALPTIGKELHTNQAQLQWVISAYALTV